MGDTQTAIDYKAKREKESQRGALKDTTADDDDNDEPEVAPEDDNKPDAAYDKLTAPCCRVLSAVNAVVLLVFCWATNQECHLSMDEFIAYRTRLHTYGHFA
ncbi:hypothetical protein ZHAS_00012264 [Anopheles sinensis]|uniref:Uncharacterized protein n=1 Tax=Anopheles sinensis TaxID=74873 RepID=A0A084W2N1_ANOSI|nr:hypothetical protein ZHAS_00012264 [Anopheles sinensis]